MRKFISNVVSIFMVISIFTGILALIVYVFTAFITWDISVANELALTIGPTSIRVLIVIITLLAIIIEAADQ